MAKNNTKKLLFIVSILFCINSYSQNEINWDGKYQLKISDFQSPSTKVGDVKVNNFMMVIGADLNFAMSNIEFMFTKNFNSKINNTFKRESSSIIAVDDKNAQAMVYLGQYGFDLSELYARKLRKKIFEEKRTLSDISFLKPLYYENQKELNELISKTSNETNLGSEKDKLEKLHEQVLKEIEELSDFCKECKTPKKNK
ncbi:hypothetical protein [Flavobacterium hydrophilum]|uniref:hypothetical protein n=1 Tax=Flavobacterium hydrophilum TaxID=2211445 RepID=UPI000D757765|nr:hypothetical protein [Flavobacterium hydrophilum]